MSKRKRESPPVDLATHIVNLYRSGELSDISIVAYDTVFSLHKCIVIANPFFRELLRSDSQENDHEISGRGKIELEDCGGVSVEAFRVVIERLYGIWDEATITETNVKSLLVLLKASVVFSSCSESELAQFEKNFKWNDGEVLKKALWDKTMLRLEVSKAKPDGPSILGLKSPAKREIESTTRALSKTRFYGGSHWSVRVTKKDGAYSAALVREESDPTASEYCDSRILVKIWFEVMVVVGDAKDNQIAVGRDAKEFSRSQANDVCELVSEIANGDLRVV
ncbi:hypothetical protein HDU83_007806, partial [Entophlyctis luteolus]